MEAEAEVERAAPFGALLTQHAVQAGVARHARERVRLGRCSLQPEAPMLVYGATAAAAAAAAAAAVATAAAAQQYVRRAAHRDGDDHDAEAIVQWLVHVGLEEALVRVGGLGLG